MFVFLYNSFNSKNDEELKSEVNRDTGLSAFSDAVNNDIKEESTRNLVARDPEQPSKAPLFDVKSNYSLSAEERLQELFLEYFNFQGNEHVVRALYWQISALKQRGVENPEEIYLTNESIRNKIIEYIKA